MFPASDRGSDGIWFGHRGAVDTAPRCGWNLGVERPAKTVDPETVAEGSVAPHLQEWRAGNDSRKTFAYVRNPPLFGNWLGMTNRIGK